MGRAGHWPAPTGDPLVGTEPRESPRGTFLPFERRVATRHRRVACATQSECGISGLKLQHALGIFVEKLSFHFLARCKLFDFRDRLRALALGPAADAIIAIAPIHELVLVALEQSAGVFFVACQRVEAGTGGEVAIHVWVLAEQ